MGHIVSKTRACQLLWGLSSNQKENIPNWSTHFVISGFFDGQRKTGQAEEIFFYDFF